MQPRPVVTQHDRKPTVKKSPVPPSFSDWALLQFTSTVEAQLRFLKENRISHANAELASAILSYQLFCTVINPHIGKLSPTILRGIRTGIKNAMLTTLREEQRRSRSAAPTGEEMLSQVEGKLTEMETEISAAVAKVKEGKPPFQTIASRFAESIGSSPDMFISPLTDMFLKIEKTMPEIVSKAVV